MFTILYNLVFLASRNPRGQIRPVPPPTQFLRSTDETFNRLPTSKKRKPGQIKPPGAPGTVCQLPRRVVWVLYSSLEPCFREHLLRMFLLVVRCSVIHGHNQPMRGESSEGGRRRRHLVKTPRDIRVSLSDGFKLPRKNTTRLCNTPRK